MARQGRAERAVGPARCRLTAACRVRRGGERVSRRRGERAQSRASPCPPAPFPCAATLVPVPLSSARFPLPGLFVSAPTRGGAAGLCPAGGRARVGRARRVASGACGRCGHPGAGASVSAVRHAEDHRGASGVVLRDRRLRPVVVGRRSWSTTGSGGTQHPARRGMGRWHRSSRRYVESNLDPKIEETCCRLRVRVRNRTRPRETRPLGRIARRTDAAGRTDSILVSRFNGS